MTITNHKPSSFQDLKTSRENESINLELLEKFGYLYSDGRPLGTGGK